jgi:hypothetical protein
MTSHTIPNNGDWLHKQTAPNKYERVVFRFPRSRQMDRNVVPRGRFLRTKDRVQFPRAVNVLTVVDSVAIGWVFSEHFSFPYKFPVHHIHHFPHASSYA